MDPRGLPMYHDPRMAMMGQSNMDSGPGPMPMNYPMGNHTQGNMGIQGQPMSDNFTSNTQNNQLSAHQHYSQLPVRKEVDEEGTKLSAHQHYSQLPVRKEVDEEGRICGVVLSKPTPDHTEEENGADHLHNEENEIDHLSTADKDADYIPTEEDGDDELWKDSKENIKTEEPDEISIFMDTAHDIFLKISSKEMKIQEASNLLGRPYSFVYTRYQEFLDNITGKATTKKKKKGAKTKKKGKRGRKPGEGKRKKSGGRFKCEECPASFRTEYLIKTHTKLHTEKIESHPCTACGILFPKLGQLMRHRMEDHGDALQCPHCEKQYTKISAYKFHVNTHTKVRPFPCTECGKGFFSKVSLEDHHRQHTGERPFMCGYCERTFVTLSNLKLHQYIHTGGRPNKPKRKKQPKPPKKYACQECGRRYISNNKLEQHMNTHTGATPYACDLCDARFSLKPNLIRHQRKHTGEKPFKCNYCPTAFSFKSELRLHDMVHTGNKPFKCTLCDYSCVRQSKLDYHMNTHTGEKPFKCDFYGCNAEYPSPSTLKQHKLKHVPAPFKECKLCHEKFPDINSLKRHMMLHPGNEPLPCDQCDKIFYNESTLKRHMHVHMYKRPENKPKIVRQRKKNPPVKRPDPPAPPIQKRLHSEYQVPFAAENGHTPISQSWTINAEDTNSQPGSLQPQQSYYHSFPASQYTNLNAWPATFDPDELRNRLLASFK